MTAKPMKNTAISRAERKAAIVWDRMADTYHKEPIKDQESYQTKLEISRNYFHSSTTKALEFGCGTGGTALLHAPYVREYLAIDVSGKMIDICKSKLLESTNSGTTIDNLTFEQSGIDELVAEAGDFDVVLGLSILHLVADKDQVLNKVHRLLKPGGVFISSTVCMKDFVPVMKYVGAFATFVGFLPALNVFTSQHLLESIENAGFVIEREFQPANDKAIFIVARKK